ncbi:MAG TPA: hypothetical protein VKU90_13370 [Caulobacteraceae bacterium]|nr:hypothetical protein [Caulobacteraceae bacterium]
MTSDQATPGKQGSTAMAVAISFSAIALCGVLAVGFVLAVGVLKAHHGGLWSVLAATAVFGLAVLAIALAAARLGQRAMRMTPSPAASRYARRFSAAMGLYVLALLAAITAEVQLRPVGALAYALAVLPALPLLAAIAAIGLYLSEETDEFQRAVQVEAALWATGGALAVATVFGFLQTFGLAPMVPAWAVFPLWSMLLGPAQMIARWRYR